MNLKEVKDLIELVSEKGFAEFEIERQGFRLRISCFKETPAHVVAPPAAAVIVSSSIPAPSELKSGASDRKLLNAEADSSDSTSAPAVQSGDTAVSENLQTIKSPIVGTFYNAPSPTSEPFVRIGDHIEPDTVVCIIEAMKLMNEIQAEVSGVISKVYVESGQPVEYGQSLFGIKTG